MAQLERVHLPSKRCRFDPWVDKISWRRKWHPTPVFLFGKSHGQRSLVGYSPWGHKESDTATTPPTTKKHFFFLARKSLDWLTWLFFRLQLGGAWFQCFGVHGPGFESQASRLQRGSHGPSWRDRGFLEHALHLAIIGQSILQASVRAVSLCSK